jgi:hypothetical protein
MHMHTLEAAIFPKLCECLPIHLTGICICILQEYVPDTSFDVFICISFQ